MDVCAQQVLESKYERSCSETVVTFHTLAWHVSFIKDGGGDGNCASEQCSLRAFQSELKEPVKGE